MVKDKIRRAGFDIRHAFAGEKGLFNKESEPINDVLFLTLTGLWYWRQPCIRAFESSSAHRVRI